MKQLTYFEERDLKNRNKIEEILSFLPDYFYGYAISLESRGLSSLSRLNYLVDLKVFIEWLSDSSGILVKDIDIRLLEGLKPIDFQSFISEQASGRIALIDGKEKLLKSGLKAQARKLSAIKSFYKYLFNNDLINSNVTTKVEAPRIIEDNHKIKRLYADEIDPMLSAVDFNNLDSHQKAYLKNTAERDNAIISLLLGTGIRVSELVGLDINDFDFKHKNFKVTRKGGKVELLYFADDLQDILEIWLNKRATLQIDKNENAMFISLQNRRMSVSSIEKMIKKYSASVGKEISPHKLRATYGTELYKATGDIYDVATALGHRDINTTKKHYADYDEDKKQKIAGKVRVEH